MDRISNFVRGKAWLASALGVALTLFGTDAAMAHSALLASGGVVYIPLPSTTVAAEPDLAGIVRYDVLVPFTIADPFGNVQCAGNLQNRVVKSKLTGEYHFYYRIRNTWGVGGIGGIATSSFGDVSHFVAFRIDGLGTVHPLFVRHTPVPGEIEFSGLNVDCRKHQESQFILIKRPWTTTAYASGVTRIFSSNGYEVSVPTVQP